MMEACKKRALGGYELLNKSRNDAGRWKAQPHSMFSLEFGLPHSVERDARCIRY